LFCAAVALPSSFVKNSKQPAVSDDRHENKLFYSWSDLEQSKTLKVLRRQEKITLSSFMRSR